jgi:putative redox protein
MAPGTRQFDVAIGSEDGSGFDAALAASLTPIELLLASLGSCTATTVNDYAEHKGWAIDEISVQLGYWVDEDARAAITRDLHLEGRLDVDQQARLRAIADRSPITKALRGGTEIATRVR